MKTVDTNLLVRLIIKDDLAQRERARGIIQSGVFVPLTVLLELGWVLASRYRLPRHDLTSVILGLLDMQGINVHDEASVRAALALYAAGADYADALHLVAARGTEAFVTFDRGVPSGASIGVDVEIVA